jgi:hypothetical protein
MSDLKLKCQAVNILKQIALACLISQEIGFLSSFFETRIQINKFDGKEYYK